MSSSLPINTLANTQLVLEDFFPYRLTQLQSTVSHTIAQLYTGRFDLTRQEWRVLAVLGNDKRSMNAKVIGALTNLDKMQTSRAIAKMAERRLLMKMTDKNDKRATLLQLTEQGRTIYQQIVPLVLTRETALLAILSEQEQLLLNQLMDKLMAQAKLLQAF